MNVARSLPQSTVGIGEIGGSRLTILHWGWGAVFFFFFFKLKWQARLLGCKVGSGFQLSLRFS